MENIFSVKEQELINSITALGGMSKDTVENVFIIYRIVQLQRVLEKIDSIVLPLMGEISVKTVGDAVSTNLELSEDFLYSLKQMALNKGMSLNDLLAPIVNNLKFYNDKDMLKRILTEDELLELGL